MAGGAGGAGGSPGGVAGASGVTQPYGSYDTVYGGAGGDNGATINDGPVVFGPFGQGGAGADVFSSSGSTGNPGAVVIIWGKGLNG